MVHNWTEDTDGNGSTVRVLLLDYKKAFDLIDHFILTTKLRSLDIPNSIISWVIDFLKCREQRVKIDQDCQSEWKSVPSGVPQGTKLGPWLFILMIDDINVSECTIWKYVDDTTIAETVEKNNTSNIQMSANEITIKSESNRFQLNEAKCKEVRISFAKSPPVFDPITINGKAIEVVDSVKLLGLNISKDLKWNGHVSEISRKASCRLYFLRQLKRASVKTKELLTFYVTCIRPITEYACPVFHNSLPQYLSDDIEHLQKRALRTIHPSLSYNEALAVSNLPTLHDRRSELSMKLFNDLISDENHKLHNLLPPRSTCGRQLRSRRKFNIPLCKTNRLKNSFIYSHCKL